MKTYIAYIHENPHEITNIEAESPEEAELTAIYKFNGGNYDNISQVEIKIVHKCDEDDEFINDVGEEFCGNCEQKL